MSSRFSGLLALLAGLTALLVSLPFAAAYFRAYPGYGTPPPWLPAFARAFPGLLEFAHLTRVYQVYGRTYSVIVPLTIPGLLLMKQWIGTDARLSRWGWRIFFGGVLLFGLGVIGDYWPDPNSDWVGMGFVLELVGMLVLWSGAILYGMAAFQDDNTPRWIGRSLIGIAPGGILGIALLAHIPSGPLLAYAIFWLVLGSTQLTEKKLEIQDE